MSSPLTDSEEKTPKELRLTPEAPSSLPSQVPYEIPLIRAVEALLFASNAPVSSQRLKSSLEERFSCSTKEVNEAIEQLQHQYREQGNAFELKRLAGGYVMQTKEEFFPILDPFFQKQPPQKLSSATYETLAIIAYRQPITRAEIDTIRGVDCTAPLSNLMEKDLVQMVGRKEVPGHPPLYGTTKEFLEFCGLGNIQDLPALRELKKPRKKTKKNKAQNKQQKQQEKKPQEINLTLPL